MISSIILFISTIGLTLFTRLVFRLSIKNKVWKKFKSQKFIENWYLWPFKERFNPVFYWGHLINGLVNIVSFLLLTIFTLCSITFFSNLFLLIHMESAIFSFLIFIFAVITQKDNDVKIESARGIISLIIIIIVAVFVAIMLGLEIFGGVFGFWEI